MARPVLVTGGTGLLGRQVVERLLAADRRVRVLSRKPRGQNPEHEWATGDLRSGRGVPDAVAGVDAIVHCATAFGLGAETDLARTLVNAARHAGYPHLVYISIVGVDRIPFGYYQRKLLAERLIQRSGLPHTILRATQFHDLIRALFHAASRPPVMPVPAFRFQPIDSGEVATQLAELALDDPAGRVPDIGGPRIREARDLAEVYLGATGRHRRRVLPIRLPGRAFRAFQEGHNLAPEHVFGVQTFEQYLAEHPESTPD